MMSHTFNTPFGYINFSIEMKFLSVLMALVAAAAAQMTMPFYGGLPYASYSPLAYAGAPAATFAYGAAPLAYAGAPVAYTAAAPVAYSAPVAPVAYAAPGPVAYQTGAKVVAKYEPVEQHGYSIAY